MCSTLLAIDFFLEGGWLPSKSVTASHLGSGNSTPAQCPTRNVITENMTSLHEFYTMYVYIYTIDCVCPKYCNSQQKGSLLNTTPKRSTIKSSFFFKDWWGWGHVQFFCLSFIWEWDHGSFWETKPIHSAQCRHVVVCTYQIKKTWESLLKTIWAWESQPWQVSNHESIKH